MSSDFLIGEDAFPAVGFGLWKIDRDKTADMVHSAIQLVTVIWTALQIMVMSGRPEKKSGLRLKPDAVGAKICG